MNIGLIDVDGHNKFPNYALIKISAYHKSIGDSVEWYLPFGSQNIETVYMSKVFTFTPDYQYNIQANKIIRGGTGYGMMQDLPAEIDSMFPDYSIYPSCNDFAIGFLTRGCIRNCPWCIVPKKEGHIRPYLTYDKIVRSDTNNIVFMDNNVLASDFGIEQIELLGKTKYKVDFNQGLDARLIDRTMAKRLAALKWYKPLRMACDSDGMLEVVERATAYLREAGCKPKSYFVYCLVQEIDSALNRVTKLNELGLDPFAQPYIDFSGKNDVSKEQKDFARWVNMKSVFRSCTWQEYRATKGWL
jgi:hypothetical protein